MIHDRHDFYHDMPDYHECNNSRLYVEQDWGAGNCDRQLPVLSTIGRGPRGKGVSVKVKADTDDEFVFEFIDDETGETVMTSPNLACPKFSIEDVTDITDAGQETKIRIRMEHGKDITDKVITIPGGQDGANIFICGKLLAKDVLNGNTVSVRDSYLDIHSPSKFAPMASTDLYGYKPTPRVNDVVIASTLSGLVLGIIVNKSGTSNEILFRTYCEFPVPTIGENGNWFIYNQDTGYKARPDFTIGTVTETTLPEATLTDTEDGYALNLGLVRGPRGKAIQIKSGVYTTSTIPAYADCEDGDAYIVDDGDGQFDLYVRGEEPSTTDNGWTVVENWQGTHGNSLCYVDQVSTHDGCTGTALKTEIKGDTPKVDDLLIDRNLQLWLVTDIDSYNVSVSVLGTSIQEILNTFAEYKAGYLSVDLSVEHGLAESTNMTHTELRKAATQGQPAVVTQFFLYGQHLPTTALTYTEDGYITFDAYHFENLNTKIRYLNVYTVKIDDNNMYSYSKREYTVVYPASADNLGSIMVGDGLSIDDNGKLSVSSTTVQQMVDDRLAAVLSTAELNDENKITFEV